MHFIFFNEASIKIYNTDGKSEAFYMKSDLVLKMNLKIVLSLL